MRNIKGGKRKKLTREAIFVYPSPRPRQGCYGRESRSVAAAERAPSRQGPSASRSDRQPVRPVQLTIPRTTNNNCAVLYGPHGACDRDIQLFTQCHRYF